jgi:DNA repair protein RadC
MNPNNETSLEFTTYEQRAISTAMRAMERVLRQPGTVLSNPNVVSDFLRLKLSSLPFEVFAVLYVDSQNQLIAFEEAFRGTLNQTSVYPREIVKSALMHNAAAVLLAHNHPSGVPEPSLADRMLTDRLKQALQLVDIATLDHIIVAGNKRYSFAEHGLI